MKNRHKKWIIRCIKESSKSKVAKYKHGCLLVKSNRIISTGINKYKKGILGSKCYQDYCNWHAELDCLEKVSVDKIKNSILYVAGWSRGGNVICSKPCRYCQEYLKKFDLKAIYYSMPDCDYAAM